MSEDHSKESANSPLVNSARVPDLRLILIAELFYPELAGAMLRFFRYGPLLQQRGIDIHVFTMKLPAHREDELKIAGISIHRMSSSDLMTTDEKRHFLTKAAIHWHKQQGECPTIIQTMTAAASLKRAGEIWMARLSGIFSVYALTMVVEQPADTTFLRKWKHRIVTKVCMSAYSGIFALSQEMRRLYAERIGISPRKINVISNGVDLKRFRPVGVDEQAIERRELGIPGNAKVVLCSGALIKRKRVHILLEAWPAVVARTPGAILLIVGAQQERSSHNYTREAKLGFDSYNEQIRCLAGRTDVAETIQIEDETSSVEKMYRAANIFVLPSRLEGLPNVLLEAMASGLPSIVNGFDGLPEDGEEIGRKNEHYIRCDGGAEEWAEAINDLLEDDEKRASIGSAARKWMEQEQDLEKVLDLLALKYREILKLGGGNA